MNAMKDNCPCGECSHLLDCSSKCTVCVKTPKWLEFDCTFDKNSFSMKFAWEIVEPKSIESFN